MILDGCFLNGCFLGDCLLFADFEQGNKISSYFAEFKQVKKLVVILMICNKLKNFCNELLRKIYHSLQGSVAKRIKQVSSNIQNYREQSSNPAGSKHFIKINVS